MAEPGHSRRHVPYSVRGAVVRGDADRLGVRSLLDGHRPDPELNTEVGVLLTWQIATISASWPCSACANKVIFLAARGRRCTPRCGGL